MKKVLFLLGQLDDEDVEWIISHGRRRLLPAGTDLIVAGHSIDAIHVILNGVLRVLTPEPHEREIARVYSGEVVGEMSFLDGRPPTATVRALAETEVLTIPRSALARRIEENDAFGKRFYRALAAFLTDRLRASVRTFGYGEPDESKMVEEDRELDPELLEQIHLASTHFDEIVRRCR